jgi:cytoskeletal protein RodZ
MEPNQVQQKSNGAFIGLIIVIAILIIGGIYLWQKNMQRKAEVQNPSPAYSETASLDANVSNMDLDSLDKGM